MKPLSVVWAKERNVSGTQFLLVSNGMGAKNDDTVKIIELLINVVI
jgi:hypothetical protein